MFKPTTFTTFAAFVTLAASQASGLIVNSPATLVQCQPAAVSWTGASGTVYLSVIQGSDVTAQPLKTFPDQSGDSGSLTWSKVDVKAGTTVTFVVNDGIGKPNYSSQVTILSSSDSACLGSTDGSDDAEAGDTTDSTSTPPSATVSEAAAPTSLTTSSAAQAAKVAATTTASTATENAASTSSSASTSKMTTAMTSPSSVESSSSAAASSSMLAHSSHDSVGTASSTGETETSSTSHGASATSGAACSNILNIAGHSVLAALAIAAIVA